MSRIERQAERVADACRHYRDACRRTHTMALAVDVCPTLRKATARRLTARARNEDHRWLAFRRELARLVAMAKGGAK